MTLGAVLLEHLQKYSDPTAVDLSQKLYLDNLLSDVQCDVTAITYFEKSARSNSGRSFCFTSMVHELSLITRVYTLA